MRIQHNIMAMSAYRNYSKNTSALSKNLEKLSSGYKINRAGDDAAGLAISEKMRAQITGLKAANKNVKDGVSLVQTAEGALQEVHDMLNRMDSLATQSANGTYDNEVDRANLQKEVTALKSEIDRIADSSNFNGQKLLNGDLDGNAVSTLKADGDATQNKSGVDAAIKAQDKVTIGGNETSLTFKLNIGAAAGAKVGTDGTVTVTLVKKTDYSAAKLQELIKNATLDAGITDKDEKAAIQSALANVTVSGKGVTSAGEGTDLAVKDATKADPTGAALKLQIGDTADLYNKMSVNVGDMHSKALGIDTLTVADQDGAAAAIQNRLEHTQNNLSVMTENIQDAESTIRDTDVADEMMSYTKNNILIQSAQAMLAQANQVPQGVLQLLQ